MGSNPIGPLSDPDTFENVTVKPNLKAFQNFVKNYDFIKNYSEFIGTLVKNLKQDYPDFNALNIYDLIDKISRENPTLYTKLEKELRNKESHNAHVISYFYDELKKAIKTNQTENEEVKKQEYKNTFLTTFQLFLLELIEKLDNYRQTELTKAEIDLLIDNIFRDYPELIAKIKYNSLHSQPTKDLYQELTTLLNNQIKMGNLMDNPKR